MSGKRSSVKYEKRAKEEEEEEEPVEEVEERREEEIQELSELRITIPEPGQKVKVKVTRIRRGKLGALVNIDRIRDPRVRERFKAQEGRDAVQICFDLDGREWCQTFLISTSPRSNMYRLAKKYGTIKPGMEIEVTFNANGFPRIVLE